MNGDRDAQIFVEGNPGETCSPASAPERTFGRRCIYESPFKVTYSLSNPNNGEWTRDADCTSGERRPVMVELSDQNRPYYGFTRPDAEFRCVRDESTIKQP
jgi:hypothetical protein